jgi:hypothetical protein
MNLVQLAGLILDAVTKLSSLGMEAFWNQDKTAAEVLAKLEETLANLSTTVQEFKKFISEQDLITQEVIAKARERLKQ